MSKKDLASIVNDVRTAMSRHSPEILTGIGIAGMFTATILAVRATPKALKKMDDRRRELDVDELTKIDAIKAAWTCYIATTITLLVSAACVIGASSQNVRRNAALATAYTLSESALREYRQKVVETIGEKKERSVQEAIAIDKVEKNPAANREVIITGKGATLCYDSLSGRYFKSDADKIRKAINEINRNLVNDMYVSLNDYYYEIGLPETKLGEDLGWNVENGLMEVAFGSTLTPENEPCLAINYLVMPNPNYYK